MSEAEVTEADAATRHRQDLLLNALQAAPGASLADLAKKVGWSYRTGEPNKSLVNRTLAALKERGLVKKEGGEWATTKVGKGRFNRETIEG